MPTCNPGQTCRIQQPYGTRCSPASHQYDQPNGAVHVVATIIKNVMASAAEAELGALFINAKEGTILRTTLEEMGHPQLDPTPIQTDNSTAYKIANGTCKQQRSKAMDMRFYWIRDRITQKQFRVYWKPGTDNYADYFTKHHAPIHHTRVRPKYLYVKGQSGNNRNYINKH